MKRIFTFGLMLTAVFALTNCTEELVDQTIPTDEVIQETVSPKEEGIPFQVYASLGAETKTEGYIDDKTGELKTRWVSTDKIHVFYEDEEGTLVNAGEFGFGENPNDDDVANGLFSGFLPSDIDADKTYNWYFAYMCEVDTNTGKVTINIPEEQEQIEKNAPTHIGGINCPMWGKVENISGKVTPRVQMEHLVSLYKLTVSNETDQPNANSTSKEGDIRIYEVGMQVRTSGEWTENNQQAALAGQFELHIKTGNITQEPSSSYGIKLKLKDSSIKLEPKDKSEFYFVAAPVDVQSRATTETRYKDKNGNVITAQAYNALSKDEKKGYTEFSVTIRCDVLDFIVNSSARPLPVRDAFNYKKGKIYKYSLPIKRLSSPHSSDIFELKSEGGRTTTDNMSTHTVENIIKIYKSASGDKKEDWIEAEPTIINVNGQNVEGYVIGNPNGTLGAITITCFAKDLFKALPIGFYLSSWNDNPAEMTIDKIKIWIPNYERSTNKSTQNLEETKTDIETNSKGEETHYKMTRNIIETEQINYANLKSRGQSERLMSNLITGTAAVILFGGFDVFAIDGGMLLSFAPGLGSKIPFSNFAKQGYYDIDLESGVNYNSVVMNDNYAYKLISNEDNLGEFLANFGASFDAIVELLTMDDSNLPQTYSFTTTTEENIEYEKPTGLSALWSDGIEVLSSKSLGTTVVPSWPPKKGEKLYGKTDLINTITNVYNAAMNKKISNYSIASLILSSPYDLIYMLRDAKVSVDLKTTSKGPCAVLWGIDVLGPKDSPKNNSTDNEEQSTY